MGLFKKLFGKRQRQSDLMQGPVEYQGKVFKNGVELGMYQENSFGYKEMRDSLDYQNELLSSVNDANEKYKADGDLNSLIQAYENAFFYADPPCKSSQNLKLVDYYMKAGWNDKAWAYTNFLFTKQEAPLEKIRFAQARILKKEGRHSDAVEYYMLGHLAKAKWNNTFDRDMFLKDIRPCANKLHWSESESEYLADVLQSQIEKRRYDEGIVTKDYREFIASVSQER